VDFSPDEGQRAVADVVTSALGRDNSWMALVDGGVVAFGVPERLGGDGLGLAEVATALTEIGRHGTVGPALATLGLGLVPLLDLASDEQQDRFLAGLTKGGTLSAALNEPGAALPDRPAVAFSDGRLSGTKLGVPYAGQADWLLVTADTAVLVVSPKADGVTLTKTPTSNHSDEYVVSFDAVTVPEADVLVGAQAHRVNQLVLATTGAFAAGLVAGALRLTADYVANREQFGKTAVHLPDRRRAAGRGLHHRPDHCVGGDVGGVAALRASGRRRRPGRARLLADLAGTAGYADLPSPTRRNGHGHHLSDGPLLLDNQGPDPAARRPVASPGSGGSAMFIELTPGATPAAS